MVTRATRLKVIASPMVMASANSTALIGNTIRRRPRTGTPGRWPRAGADQPAPSSSPGHLYCVECLTHATDVLSMLPAVPAFADRAVGRGTPGAPELAEAAFAERVVDALQVASVSLGGVGDCCHEIPFSVLVAVGGVEPRVRSSATSQTATDASASRGQSRTRTRRRWKGVNARPHLS
jgi:hypothetical protein